MTKHQLKTLSLSGLGKLRDAIEAEIAISQAHLSRGYCLPCFPEKIEASIDRMLAEVVEINEAIAAREVRP